MAEPIRLRLFENYRFVLYAPFYAAHAIGAYAEEGLEVELLPSPGPGRAEVALAAGEVDVIWMGPIRLMKHHDDNPGSPLVAFAEVVSRDPFSLVGADQLPDFRLVELGHMRFASTSEVPTPWLCLEQDLRDGGVDPGWLRRITDRTMAQNVSALHDNSIDVAQLFEPFVEQAVAGGAHIWHRASARGRTAYTVFVANRARLAGETPRALAGAIADYFPELDRSVLTRSLARYKEQGVWAADPVPSVEGFERLQRALLGSKFLNRAVPFADCVDISLAEAAARSDVA
jgi:NitT/TauT family transport system substrate-binding protein